MRQWPGIDKHDVVIAFLQFDRGSHSVNSRANNDDSRHVTNSARCSSACVKRRCGYLPKCEVRVRPLALSRYSQRAFSFEQGRMRVIKAAVERVRCEVAQIFLGQF